MPESKQRKCNEQTNQKNAHWPDILNCGGLIEKRVKDSYCLGPVSRGAELRELNSIRFCRGRHGGLCWWFRGSIFFIFLFLVKNCVFTGINLVLICFNGFGNECIGLKWEKCENKQQSECRRSAGVRNSDER